MYHHTNVTRKKVFMYLPIVWVLGILEQSLNGLGLSVRGETCAIGTSSYRAKLFVSMGVVFVVAHFFLPVLLVLFLYGHMMIQLRTSKKPNTGVTGANRDDVLDKAQRNVFKTMMIITICYAICYIFNSVYSTLNLLGILETLTG